MSALYRHGFNSKRASDHHEVITPFPTSSQHQARCRLSLSLVYFRSNLCEEPTNKLNTAKQKRLLLTSDTFTMSPPFSVTPKSIEKGSAASRSLRGLAAAEEYRQPEENRVQDSEDEKRRVFFLLSGSASFTSKRFSTPFFHRRDFLVKTSRFTVWKTLPKTITITLYTASLCCTSTVHRIYCYYVVNETTTRYFLSSIKLWRDKFLRPLHRRRRERVRAFICKRGGRVQCQRSSPIDAPKGLQVLRVFGTVGARQFSVRTAAVLARHLTLVSSGGGEVFSGVKGGAFLVGGKDPLVLSPAVRDPHPSRIGRGCLEKGHGGFSE